jgi:hypothetical protein
MKQSIIGHAAWPVTLISSGYKFALFLLITPIACLNI